MWPIALACLYLAIVVLALWRAVRQLGCYETVARNEADHGVDGPEGPLSPTRRRSGDGHRPLRSALPR
jgi:hypothetical protein